MAIRLAAVAAGFLLGLSGTSGVVPLGIVALAFGVLMTAAFRPTPGAVAAVWHRLHNRDPLYTVYARVGPYTSRFGAAVIGAALLRVVS